MLGYRNYKVFLRTYGLLVGLTTIAFILRLSAFNKFTLRQHIIVQLVSVVLVIVIWESLRAINTYLNRSLPFENHLTKRIAVQLACGALVGITVRTLVYYFGEPQLPFKLDEMFAAVTWLIYIIITVVINLAFFADFFIRQWKDSLVKNERLEKEKAQVQFDNLKNQLNPHFLFNALTSLNSLISENQQLASQFLQQLAKVYRYVLQNKEKNFVDLNTELDFIQHYISLLKTRFHNALQISLSIDAAAQERAIVPVTLQILIENALKHNIVDHNKPLHIEIITIGDYLIVSNNLQLRRPVETSNKMGLENLKSLYRFLTPQPVVVEQTGTRFFVKVPLL